jgi:hypothetical protein
MWFSTDKIGSCRRELPTGLLSKVSHSTVPPGKVKCDPHEEWARNQVLRGQLSMASQMRKDVLGQYI